MDVYWPNQTKVLTQHFFTIPFLLLFITLGLPESLWGANKKNIRLSSLHISSQRSGQIQEEREHKSIIAKTTTQDVEPTKWKLFIAHSLAGGGLLGYSLYARNVFWDDASFHRFTLNDWDDPIQFHYAGGTDKLFHAFGGYFITRTLAKTYKWAGIGDKKASWLGFSFAQALLLSGEIVDGFTLRYGFDPVDAAANVVGGLIGVAEELSPTFDRCFDFRMNYWPSQEYRKREAFHSIAEDYSGQRFYFVFKPGEFHALQNWEWIRYLEVYCGFHSKGYMPGYDHSLKYLLEESLSSYQSYYKERNIYFGFSLNLKELLDKKVFRENKNFSKPIQQGADFFFEFYQHPVMFGSDLQISREKYYHRK